MRGGWPTVLGDYESLDYGDHRSAYDAIQEAVLVEYSKRQAAHHPSRFLGARLDESKRSF